jgi:uncharacterized membrane protein
MAASRSWASFAVVLACAGLFVLSTSAALPDRVASHFAASGAADGFAPREEYRTFMLGFVVGFPFLVTTLMAFAFSRTSTTFNLPNREFWLAPERRAETVRFLVRRAQGFGMLLSVYLCYVHWLVLGANASAPPRLASTRMIVGLVVFVAANLVWLTGLWSRFRRVDAASGGSGSARPSGQTREGGRAS